MLDLPVPAMLGPFVRSIRVVADSEMSDRYRRLPDCESELLIHAAPQRTAATFFGTRTRLLDKPATDKTGVVLLVRFRTAGACAFFREPMSELTDDSVPLEALWGRSAQELFDVREPEGVAEVVTAVLQHKLQRAHEREPACVPAVRRAVRRARAAELVPRVRELADELGVSERQLRRDFDAVVGLSPTRFLRILRLRRALHDARASRQPEWAAIAERHGYFDQAHLIADFRALTGRTPNAFTTRVST
jgi:AraC-like DNA-binding protein